MLKASTPVVLLSALAGAGVSPILPTLSPVVPQVAAIMLGVSAIPLQGGAIGMEGLPILGQSAVGLMHRLPVLAKRRPIGEDGSLVTGLAICL